MESHLSSWWCSVCVWHHQKIRKKFEMSSALGYTVRYMWGTCAPGCRWHQSAQRSNFMDPPLTPKIFHVRGCGVECFLCAPIRKLSSKALVVVCKDEGARTPSRSLYILATGLHSRFSNNYCYCTHAASGVPIKVVANLICKLYYERLCALWCYSAEMRETANIRKMSPA